MSYNKLNHLKKIIDIQNIYLEHNAKGVSGEFIYKRMINPVYKVSRATFYKYLAINAKKELKEIDPPAQELVAPNDWFEIDVRSDHP
jgi:hypothetical protein